MGHDFGAHLRVLRKAARSENYAPTGRDTPTVGKDHSANATVFDLKALQRGAGEDRDAPVEDGLEQPPRRAEEGLRVMDMKCPMSNRFSIMPPNIVKSAIGGFSRSNSAPRARPSKVCASSTRPPIAASGGRGGSRENRRDAPGSAGCAAP